METMKPPMIQQQSTASEPSPHHLMAEHAVSRERKKLADAQRSRSVGAAPAPRKAPKSGGNEPYTFYQVCTDFLGITGKQRYGNLLTRGSTEDSDHSRHRQSPADILKQDSQGSNAVQILQQNDNCVSIAVQFPQSFSLSQEGKKESLAFRQSDCSVPLMEEKEKVAAKHRIFRRQELFRNRRLSCVICAVFAIAGLVLMMIEEEVTALKLVSKNHWVSYSLRSLVMLSTVCLLVNVLTYHAIEIQIFLVSSGAEDWRVAITGGRVVAIALELAVCAVCPFPGTGTVWWSYISPQRVSTDPTVVPVPLDVLLALPMFLRCYWFGRVMVLHSRQFQDTGTRSIAALNQVTVDFRFVAKTLMGEYPVTVLTVFALSICCCAAWMLTQCERFSEDCDLAECNTYLNALWLVIITFLSIGYGDVVPHTYCGRFVAISTGIVGAGVSSTLIAVISRKIELSRSEKQVNNFVADSKLVSKIRNAAAAVLQETWHIHRYKTNAEVRSAAKIRQHQRKFLTAIYKFRRIKWAQRKLKERQFEVVDMGKSQHDIQETINSMQETQEHMVGQIDLLSRNVSELQQQLVTLIAHTKDREAAHIVALKKATARVSRNPPLRVLASHPSNTTVDMPTFLLDELDP